MRLFSSFIFKKVGEGGLSVFVSDSLFIWRFGSLTSANFSGELVKFYFKCKSRPQKFRVSNHRTCNNVTLSRNWGRVTRAGSGISATGQPPSLGTGEWFRDQLRGA